MLNDMLSYSTAIIEAMADFLSAEPMIYVVGLIAVAVIIKLFALICGLAKM